MEPKERDNELVRNITSWIVSLAVSVVFCAVWFVIFAQYVVDIKRNVALTNEKLEVMSERDEQLVSEIKAMHRIMVANTQAVANVTAATPAPAAAAPAPVAVPPVAAAPVAESAPAASNPAQVVTPSIAPVGSSVPAALPPVTVPTVPAK